MGARSAPLIGGYPAVYGLVGAFTFLIWTRLAAENANRMRAFTLIGMLLLFQLVFGLIFGGAGLGWIAEIAGFGFGFALSFVLVDGAWPARWRSCASVNRAGRRRAVPTGDSRR